MRAVAHLCALILLIPQALVLSAFTILDRLTAGRTLGRFFTNALDILAFVFGWRGLLVLLAVLAIAIAGFPRSSRPVAAAIVALFAVFSTIVLMTHGGAPGTVDEAMFYAPALIAAVLAGWVVYAELRRPRVA